MIELRWLTFASQDSYPHNLELKLQYRAFHPSVDASGAFSGGEWSDWKDVPVFHGPTFGGYDDLLVENPRIVLPKISGKVE